jgi:hypothetical protein
MLQMPTNSYEVLLGGWDNTQSVVRAGTQGMTLASYRHQPFAASCDEFRSFWVRYYALLVC